MFFVLKLFEILYFSLILPFVRVPTDKARFRISRDWEFV
ncbi:hypothetical protein LEP1GSC105_0876 [Leptospira interrogans str. UI 12758]|uniref:Uncharacterized protein n=1 Tax=Leptospira interrogans str. UI 12758 TaxID=1049938 RepID=A0A0E2CXZ3_LEPIR|nr:hypothetical protein LEP1GSC105_0876 [Leptospira interrogans str. UI 12758]EMN69165.1 hypothetical protein LEP1GSC098_1175 [Leptospira interrogans serovar Grippotyphosa str. UI 08434]